VHVTNLVRIHEARIAHHVAAIGQINRQHGATAKFNIRRSMLVNVGIFGGAKVAAEEERFDSFQERRISSHHVCELAMLRASLAHDDTAVFL
jgi:hypothetical protein